MMDEVLVIAFALLLVAGGVVFLIRLLGLAAHAIGLNPPEWMIDNAITGVPSRFEAAIVLLIFLYLVASTLFDLPVFDLIDPAKEAAQ